VHWLSTRHCLFSMCVGNCLVTTAAAADTVAHAVTNAVTDDTATDDAVSDASSNKVPTDAVTSDEDPDVSDTVADAVSEAVGYRSYLSNQAYLDEHERWSCLSRRLSIWLLLAEGDKRSWRQ